MLKLDVGTSAEKNKRLFAKTQWDAVLWGFFSDRLCFISSLPFEWDTDADPAEQLCWLCPSDFIYSFIWHIGSSIALNYTFQFFLPDSKILLCIRDGVGPRAPFAQDLFNEACNKWLLFSWNILEVPESIRNRNPILQERSLAWGISRQLVFSL